MDKNINKEDLFVAECLAEVYNSNELEHKELLENTYSHSSKFKNSFSTSLLSLGSAVVAPALAGGGLLGSMTLWASSSMSTGLLATTGSTLGLFGSVASGAALVAAVPFAGVAALGAAASIAKGGYEMYNFFSVKKGGGKKLIKNQ